MSERIQGHHGIGFEANEPEKLGEETLAIQLTHLMTSENFGDSRIVSVDSKDILSQLNEAKMEQDYRVKAEPEEGIASTFEGVAFDPEKLRSQSFAIYEQEKPVGVMSLVIAPKPWIEQQRYYKKEDDGVRVVDAHTITAQDIPDFYIIPGWTQVTPSHKGKFAARGFSMFKKAIELIQSNAPKNTWMEVTAQGRLDRQKRKASISFAREKHDKFIPKDELPFDIETIGEIAPGSSSTAKMARLMGLERVEDVGSDSTLGPIFAKKVK